MQTMTRFPVPADFALPSRMPRSCWIFSRKSSEGSCERRTGLQLRPFFIARKIRERSLSPAQRGTFFPVVLLMDDVSKFPATIILVRRNSFLNLIVLCLFLPDVFISIKIETIKPSLLLFLERIFVIKIMMQENPQ